MPTIPPHDFFIATGIMQPKPGLSTFRTKQVKVSHYVHTNMRCMGRKPLCNALSMVQRKQMKPFEKAEAVHSGHMDGKQTHLARRLLLGQVEHATAGLPSVHPE
jgi:hypothetical protein